MMKFDEMNLSDCSDEEMVDIIAQAVKGLPGSGKTAAIMPGDPKMTLTNPNSGLFAKRMGQYIAMLRAMQLWYHGAHHATRGASFAADHATLFSELYQNLGEEVDSAIEKAVGISNDEQMSCPKCITALASQVINKYPSPATITSLAIAATALQLEKDYLTLNKAVFEELESADCLTLGLNDYLMASYNAHEGHVYKLQQRVKTELED